MDSIIFLIMRRMRAPLITLIVSYAVAILGLVMVPGQDAAGHPDHMSIFHAFYVITYTSTTIGFGELPAAFTDAQRLWMIYAIFGTVAVWLWAAGTLIALLQDTTFRRALADRRFAARVARPGAPFYLVCGYGQTGGALVRALTDHHQRAVVIDSDPNRVNLLALENHREYVPALCGDARRPTNLLAAGLTHPNCLGVVALTDVNETNLKVSIAAKLLRPGIRVVCRADSQEVEATMAAFGTDLIYDPFDLFARYLAIAVGAPGMTLLWDWLTAESGSPLPETRPLPRAGLWVICGYGRFGKAVYRHLSAQGMDLIVVEALPQLTEAPPEGLIQGTGAEAATLEQAQIGRAVALVAGTDNDATNLSIIMTARRLNPDLCVVARKNHLDNKELFARAGAWVVMHPSLIVADGVRVRLTLPLLWEFLRCSHLQDDGWACALIGRLATVLDGHPPQVWQALIDQDQAPAVLAAEEATDLTLEHLVTDPRDRDLRLPALPLLLERGTQRLLLPALSCPIVAGDRLLFCGREGARRGLEWTLHDRHALHYVITGEDGPDGWLWRYWHARRRSAPSDPLRLSPFE